MLPKQMTRVLVILVAATSAVVMVGCASGTHARSVDSAPMRSPTSAAAPAADTHQRGPVLTAREIAEVDAIGSTLATKPGTPVEVVRTTGARAWNALSPDVSNGARTQAIKGQASGLIVKCDVNVNSGAWKGIPGGPAVTVAEIVVILDANGGAPEEMRIARGATNPRAAAIAALGPSTTVTLSNASFVDHP